MYYYLLSSKDVGRNAKQLAARVQRVCKDVAVYDLPDSQHPAVKDELPQDCKTLVVIRIERPLTRKETKAIRDELFRHYQKPFSMGELDFAELIAYVNGQARAISTEREKTADAVAADQTAIEAALKGQHGPRGLAKNIWKALFKLYLYDPQSEAVQSLVLAIAKSSLMHRHAPRLVSAQAAASAAQASAVSRPRGGDRRRVSFAGQGPVLEQLRRNIEERVKQADELTEQINGFKKKIGQLEVNQLRSGAEEIDAQVLQEYQAESRRLINEREALKAQIAELEKQAGEQKTSAIHGELEGAQSRISVLQAELEQLKQNRSVASMPADDAPAADAAATPLPNRDQLFTEVVRLSKFMEGFLKSPEATDEKRAALQLDMARLRAGLTALMEVVPSTMDSTESTAAQEEVRAKIEKIDELRQLLTVKPDAETQARIKTLEQTLEEEREKAARLEASLAEFRVAALTERAADDRPGQEAFDLAQRALRDAQVELYRLKSGQSQAGAPLSQQLSVMENDFLQAVKMLETWLKENCFYLQEKFLEFLKQLIHFVRTFAENTNSDAVNQYKRAMNSLYPALLSDRTQFTSPQETALYQMLGDIVSLNVESEWAREKNISFLFQYIGNLIHQANAAIQFYREDDENVGKINQHFREGIQRHLLMLNGMGEKISQIVASILIFERIQVQANAQKVLFKGAENLAEVVSLVKETERNFVERRKEFTAAYIEMTDEQRRMCGNPVVTKRELEQTIEKKRGELNQLQEKNKKDEEFCQHFRERLENLGDYREQEMAGITANIREYTTERDQIRESIRQEKEAWEKNLARNRDELEKLDAKKNSAEGLTKNEQAQYGILTSAGRLRVSDTFSASNLATQEAKLSREISALTKDLENYPDVSVLSTRFKRQLDELERDMNARRDMANALSDEVSVLEGKVASFDSDLEKNKPKYEALNAAIRNRDEAYQEFKKIIEKFKNEVEVHYNADYLKYLEKMKKGILALISQQRPGLNLTRFKFLLDVELNLAWSISLYRRLSFQCGREGFSDFVKATQMMPLASRVQSANEERSRAGLIAGFAVAKKEEKKEEKSSAGASSAASAIKQASEESIADLLSIETTFVESCITVLMEAGGVSFYQAFLIFAECIYSAFSADVEALEIRQYLYLLFYNLSMTSDEVSLPRLTNLQPGFFTRLSAPLFDLFFYEIGQNAANHTSYFTVAKPAPVRAVVQTAQQSALLAKFAGLNNLARSIGQKAGSNNMLLYFPAALKELIGSLPRLQDDDFESYKKNIIDRIFDLFNSWINDPQNLEKMLKDGASFVHRGEVIKRSKDTGSKPGDGHEHEAKQDDSLLDDSQQLSLDKVLLDKIDLNLDQNTFRAIMINLKRALHQQFIDAKLDLSGLYLKMAAVLALRLQLVGCDEAAFNEQLESLLKQKTEEAVLFDVAAIKHPDEADQQRKLAAFNEEAARRKADAELLLQRLRKDLAALAQKIESAESINRSSLENVQQSFSPLEQAVTTATTALSTEQQARQSQQSRYEQLSDAGVPDEQAARRLIEQAMALSQNIAAAKERVQTENDSLDASHRCYEENPQRASLLRLGQLLGKYLEELYRIERAFISNVQSFVDAADFQAQLSEVEKKLLELQACYKLPDVEVSEEALRLLRRLTGLLADFQGLESSVMGLLASLNRQAEEYRLSEADRKAREAAETAARERVAREKQAARDVLGAEVTTALAPAESLLADLPSELARAKASMATAQTACDEAKKAFSKAQSVFSVAVNAADASLQRFSNQLVDSLDAANTAIRALFALQERGQSFGQLGECFNDLTAAQEILATKTSELASQQRAFNTLVDSKQSAVRALKAQLEGFQTRAQSCGYSNSDLDGRLTTCNTWLTNDRLGFSQYPSVSVVSSTVERIDSQSQEKTQLDYRYGEHDALLNRQKELYGRSLLDRLNQVLTEANAAQVTFVELYDGYQKNSQSLSTARAALQDEITRVNTAITTTHQLPAVIRTTESLLGSNIEQMALDAAGKHLAALETALTALNGAKSAYDQAVSRHAGIGTQYQNLVRDFDILKRASEALQNLRSELDRDSGSLQSNTSEEREFHVAFKRFTVHYRLLSTSDRAPQVVDTMLQQLKNLWEQGYQTSLDSLNAAVAEARSIVQKKRDEKIQFDAGVKSFAERFSAIERIVPVVSGDTIPAQTLHSSVAEFNSAAADFQRKYPRSLDAQADSNTLLVRPSPLLNEADIATMTVAQLVALSEKIEAERAELLEFEKALQARQRESAARLAEFKRHQSEVASKNSATRASLQDAEREVAALKQLLRTLKSNGNAAPRQFDAQATRLTQLEERVTLLRQQYDRANTVALQASFDESDAAELRALASRRALFDSVVAAVSARKAVLSAEYSVKPLAQCAEIHKRKQGFELDRDTIIQSIAKNLRTIKNELPESPEEPQDYSDALLMAATAIIDYDAKIKARKQALSQLLTDLRERQALLSSAAVDCKSYPELGNFNEIIQTYQTSFKRDRDWLKQYKLDCQAIDLPPALDDLTVAIQEGEEQSQQARYLGRESVSELLGSEIRSVEEEISLLEAKERSCSERVEAAKAMMAKQQRWAKFATRLPAVLEEFDGLMSSPIQLSDEVQLKLHCLRALFGFTTRAESHDNDLPHAFPKVSVFRMADAGFLKVRNLIGEIDHADPSSSGLRNELSDKKLKRVDRALLNYVEQQAATPKTIHVLFSGLINLLIDMRKHLLALKQTWSLSVDNREKFTSAFDALFDDQYKAIKAGELVRVCCGADGYLEQRLTELRGVQKKTRAEQHILTLHELAKDNRYTVLVKGLVFARAMEDYLQEIIVDIFISQYKASIPDLSNRHPHITVVEAFSILSSHLMLLVKLFNEKPELKGGLSSLILTHAKFRAMLMAYVKDEAEWSDLKETLLLFLSELTDASSEFESLLKTKATQRANDPQLLSATYGQAFVASVRSHLDMILFCLQYYWYANEEKELIGEVLRDYREAGARSLLDSFSALPSDQWLGQVVPDASGSECWRVDSSSRKLSSAAGSRTSSSLSLPASESAVSSQPPPSSYAGLVQRRAEPSTKAVRSDRSFAKVPYPVSVVARLYGANAQNSLALLQSATALRAHLLTMFPSQDQSVQQTPPPRGFAASPRVVGRARAASYDAGPTNDTALGATLIRTAPADRTPPPASVSGMSAVARLDFSRVSSGAAFLSPSSNAGSPRSPRRSTSSVAKAHAALMSPRRNDGRGAPSPAKPDADSSAARRR